MGEQVQAQICIGRGSDRKRKFDLLSNDFCPNFPEWVFSGNQV
jgi:hypothetical protein